MNMMATPTTSSILATRAMVVNLSISQWSGRRLDRQVTDEVNASHNADSDAGRFNKLLLPKEALADITRIVSATRTEFTARTLPWIDDGGRIMAADAYLAHAAWIRGQQTKFDAAVRGFITEYPRYVAEARTKLGSMFKADDYPAPDEIEKKFSMSTTVMPVPTAKDFRVEMADSQAAAIRADIERNVQDAMMTAVRDVYRRVAEVTGRMVERLHAYRPAKGPGDKSEGVFRDSLVDNVRDLVQIMPALNIVGDPQLTELADKLRELTHYDADTLRKNQKARTSTHDKAKSILAQVSDYI